MKRTPSLGVVPVKTPRLSNVRQMEIKRVGRPGGELVGVRGFHAEAEEPFRQGDNQVLGVGHETGPGGALLGLGSRHDLGRRGVIPPEFEKLGIPRDADDLRAERCQLLPGLLDPGRLLVEVAVAICGVAGVVVNDNGDFRGNSKPRSAQGLDLDKDRVIPHRGGRHWSLEEVSNGCREFVGHFLAVFVEDSELVP